MTRDEIKNKIQLTTTNVNKKKLQIREEGLNRKKKKTIEGLVCFSAWLACKSKKKEKEDKRKVISD